LKRQLMADLNAATSGAAPGSAATSPIRDIHFVLNPGLTGPTASRPQGAEG
jgi:hypothetical protein